MPEMTATARVLAELKRRLYESRDYTSTAMVQRSVELAALIEIVELHYAECLTFLAAERAVQQEKPCERPAKRGE